MHKVKIFKQFLSHCDNGFVGVDGDFCIIDVNEAVCELTGRKRKALLGTGIEILFDEFSVEKIISIYKAFSCEEICQRINGDLLQKKGMPRSAEIQVNCADTDRWLLVKNKSFRREMEEKLRQSELMLSTALESLPFDFWINDAENRTYMQNSYSKKLWGDVKGRKPEDVGADSETTSHWLETIKKAFSGEVVNSEIEYTIEGQKRSFRNIVAPVKDEDTILGILGMNIDITDLKEALETKNMLLKEIHHRVKNNLQMISSIIHLETYSITNEQEKILLEDLISRIETFSLIHEKLYLTDSNTIHAADYIRDLVDHIVSGADKDGIVVEYDLDDIDLQLDIMISMGLIINELVTNSIKYAFNADGNNLLGVSLKQSEAIIKVVVSDNGPGFNADNTQVKSNKLGFKMMDVFADQLSGKIEKDCSIKGCSCKLEFPLNE